MTNHSVPLCSVSMWNNCLSSLCLLCCANWAAFWLLTSTLSSAYLLHSQEIHTYIIHHAADLSLKTAYFYYKGICVHSEKCFLWVPCFMSLLYIYMWGRAKTCMYLHINVHYVIRNFYIKYLTPSKAICVITHYDLCFSFEPPGSLSPGMSCDMQAVFQPMVSNYIPPFKHLQCMLQLQ